MADRSVVRKAFLLTALVATLDVSGAGSRKPVEPPPNAPATIEWVGSTGAEPGKLSLRYHGAGIFSGTVRAEDADGNEVKGLAVKLEQSKTVGDKVEQRLKFVPAEARPGVKLVLQGMVVGSGEAFPAETLSEAQKRFPCVRTSVGLSRNLRNNAVYDRRWDWVLIGPADGATRIAPRQVGENQLAFSWESRGPSLEFVFRPRFYQQHQGFKYYEPWNYKVWKGSVTGYCTWWSYRGNFTQATLDAMLAVFVKKRLPDFGYDYMQFDNCYQIGNGSCPENWLNWDKRKYPGGWKHAMQVIHDAGMKPGIWVHRVHRPSDPGVKDIIEKHPDWFVPGADGKPHLQSGFASLNTLNEAAVDNMIRKLYRELKQQGWDYVKIDGTGDLLRAYQNKNCAEFFENHPTTPEQSLRQWDIVAREELGPEVYILACHTVGNAKNVIGLVDGGRLSNDGFQPRTLAQYNLLEGVVWRGDPDHCDILGGWLMDEDAMMPVFATEAPAPARTIIRPAICAMAGAALMVSDKVEAYQDDQNLEGMKRSAPVPFTVPGQLYSCGRQAVPWWLQEIDRPFDHWSVLARFQWGEETRQEKNRKWELQGVPEAKVAFADLGLHDDREYLVFEFWSQKFLGKCKGSFTAPAMDDNTGLQVFAIREAREHPWVLSTTRHLSQGGVSLSEVKWDANAKILSGKSKVIIGDPYVLTVHLPDGYRVETAEIGGDKVEITNQTETATVRIAPPATKTVEWTIKFSGKKD